MKTAIAVTAILIGMMIGYCIGTVVTIRWGVDVALNFLEIDDVDRDAIVAGIIKYQNHLRNEWKGDPNALIYADTRNQG